jgi:hypothetical protein
MVDSTIIPFYRSTTAWWKRPKVKIKFLYSPENSLTVLAESR